MDERRRAGLTADPSPAAPSRTRRIDWIEWLRAAGCVAIVILHVFVSLYIAVDSDALGAVRIGVEAVLSVVLARWAVPAFLMVSGMLLLDPSHKVDGHRLWVYARRMLFVLGSFGFAFCLIESAYDAGGLSGAVVAEAALNLLTGRSWDHLWYVYALLALYALTPLFRAVVRRLSQRALAALLLALYLLVLVVPTALWFGGVYIETPANVLPAAFYYLLGWYVGRYLRLSPTVVVVGLCSLAAMTYFAATDRELLALPEYCFVPAYGVLALLLFRRYATAPIDAHPLAALLSDLSFGIYVIHPLFLHLITHLMDPLAVPVGIYELGALAVALGGSIVSVRALRHLPGFARYL